MAKVTSSLSSAANKIVNINRSTSVMRSTQSSYSEFLRFMDIETKNLQSIKFDQKKLKKAYSANVTATFGSAGNLLSGLASGALDVGSLLGGMFGGRDKPSARAGKPIPKGQKIRIPGVRGLGILTPLLAGLDFAQGVAGGESVGQAASGAVGSAVGAAAGGAAGVALAGLIGQTLVPVPGLGFVLGAAVGSLGAFAGGYLGDRAYETVTGEGAAKEKIQAKLKAQEAQQRAESRGIGEITFPQVLDKFDGVVYSFSRFAGAAISGAAAAAGAAQEGAPMEYGPPEPELQAGKDTGQELQDVEAEGGRKPSSSIITSGFGKRWGRQHYGTDYGEPEGTPVSVIQPGTVAFAGYGGAGGNTVHINHPDGSQTRYLHFQKTPNVKTGQQVEPGTVIGYVGSTGRSTGPHLHFEYAPPGQGSVNSAPHADKYFRFGGNVKVKPGKGSSSAGAGAPTAVLAAGTNDFGNPAAAKANVTKTIKELQSKGYNVVVVPPNESGKFAEVSKAVQEAASSSGATIEKGKYDTKDPLHLQMSEASRIKQKYGNAQFIGDSNAVRISGGGNVTGQRVVGAGTGDILQFAQGMGRVAPSQAAQVQAVPQKNTAPQQIQQVQQYPSYVMGQNTTTLIPIIQGSGGSQPMVISSGGGGASGGGRTVVMSGPSEGDVLNSLMKNILLTSLSAT